MGYATGRGTPLPQRVEPPSNPTPVTGSAQPRAGGVLPTIPIPFNTRGKECVDRGVLGLSDRVKLQGDPTYPTLPDGFPFAHHRPVRVPTAYVTQGPFDTFSVGALLNLKD